MLHRPCNNRGNRIANLLEDDFPTEGGWSPLPWFPDMAYKAKGSQMAYKAKLFRKTSTNLDGFDADSSATCNNDVFTRPTHNNRFIQYILYLAIKRYLPHHFSMPETGMTFTKSATPSVAKLGRARRSRNKGRTSKKSRTSMFIVLHRAAVRRVQPLKLMVNEKCQHFSDSPCKIFLWDSWA